jgi:hypothetical protein
MPIDPNNLPTGGGIGRMLSFPAAIRVYLCTVACDMRRSFDGLAMMAEHIVQSSLPGVYVSTGGFDEAWRAGCGEDAVLAQDNSGSSAERHIGTGVLPAEGTEGPA